MDLETHLRRKLEEMSALIFSRDMSIVDLFWSGGRFWLYGSEAHEVDETREDLIRHMNGLFAKPYRIRFRFARLSADRLGEVAWVNAPATLVIVHADRTVELPYRLFAVFQNIEGAWHWRVFSGSEPAAPPSG